MSLQLHRPEQPHSTVCIIGLGYVGLTLAVGLAEAGYSIIGIENNSSTLAHLRAGKPHFKENGLDARYAYHFQQGAIRVEDSIPAGAGIGVYVITVGTPVDHHKKAKMEAIRSVAAMIAAHLKENDTVILRSTVKIGTSRSVVKPTLDAAGVSYHLAMCPERTVEGRAMEELKTLPQIIGGIDAASARAASTLFSKMTDEIITVSSLEAAELAKLVCNTQRDLMFAYANEVALMADAVGVPVQEIIYAANHHYPRSKLAKPGLVGGPCMEKDTYILAEGMAEYGFTPEIVLSARKLNDDVVRQGVQRVKQWCEEQGKNPSSIQKVAILGLAFKGEPETSDLRGTCALPLHQAIVSAFPAAAIAGFDPLASREEALALNINAVLSIEEALRDAEIIFVQNNHALFRDDKLAYYMELPAKGAVIYDFWGVVSPDITQYGDIALIGLGNAHGKRSDNEKAEIPVKAKRKKLTYT